MSNVLVVAEVTDGALKKATLTSVSFARQAAARQGGNVQGLVIGSGVSGAAEELAKYVETVHVADDDALSNPMAESYAVVVKAAAEAAGRDPCQHGRHGPRQRPDAASRGDAECGHGLGRDRLRRRRRHAAAPSHSGGQRYRRGRSHHRHQGRDPRGRPNSMRRSRTMLRARPTP